MGSEVGIAMIEIHIGKRFFFYIQCIQCLDQLLCQMQRLCRAGIASVPTDTSGQMQKPLHVIDGRKRGRIVESQRIEQWPQFFVQRQIAYRRHPRQHQTGLGRAHKGRC